MRIELLYWSGCPSHPKALRELRDALASSALDPDSVIVREVASEQDAQAEQFVGSPTIRINGVDVLPSGDEPFGLTCRVYRRRDGRFSPTPDPDDLLDALRAAVAVSSVGG